jgi:hypothetical protein
MFKKLKFLFPITSYIYCHGFFKKNIIFKDIRLKKQDKIYENDLKIKKNKNTLIIFIWHYRE